MSDRHPTSGVITQQITIKQPYSPFVIKEQEMLNSDTLITHELDLILGHKDFLTN